MSTLTMPASQSAHAVQASTRTRRGPRPTICCRDSREHRRGNHLRDTNYRGSASPWRLTSRGRAVFVVMALIIVSLAVVLGAIRATAASTTPPEGWVASIVQPGDTLWSLATEGSSNQTDPRAIIAEIKAINGLTGSHLAPGQRLFLPS